MYTRISLLISYERKISTMKTQNEMTIKTLIPFLMITFGLTWGLASLLDE